MKKSLKYILVAFGISMIIFSLFQFSSNAFLVRDNDLTSQFKNNFKYVLVYFIFFISFYFLVKKNLTKINFLIFSIVFLLTCPTIDSSQRSVTDREFYGGWLEKKTEANTGYAYNKLNPFIVSFYHLFIVKKSVRWEQSHIDTNEFSFKRFAALSYSNTYQVHFFSVIINLLLFVLFFYTAPQFIIKDEAV